MDNIAQSIYDIWNFVKPFLIIVTGLNICLYIFFHTRIKKYPEKIDFLLDAKKRLAFWVLSSIVMLIFMEIYHYFTIK